MVLTMVNHLSVNVRDKHNKNPEGLQFWGIEAPNINGEHVITLEKSVNESRG